MGWRLRVGLTVVVMMSCASGWCAGPAGSDVAGVSPKEIVSSMLAHENEAEKHRDHYVYVSEERSERTGGHLWKERVVETNAGKVRALLAEDGQPLSGARLEAERARLAEIAAHPEEFARSSEGMKNDEQHAREMLTLLPKAFLFENVRQEGDLVKVDFRPNPEYVPQSLEERVLHAMTGSLVVDQRGMRLREIDARLPADVSIGFGLIATIKAGSNFSTTRQLVYGNEWKTEKLDTAITGRAIFFKTIGKMEHAEHADFHLVPHEITVAQAVALAQNGQ
jgi:hypothetical protein